MSDLPSAGTSWFAKTLSEGTYRNADEVLTALLKSKMVGGRLVAFSKFFFVSDSDSLTRDLFQKTLQILISNVFVSLSL